MGASFKITSYRTVRAKKLSIWFVKLMLYVSGPKSPRSAVVLHGVELSFHSTTAQISLMSRSAPNHLWPASLRQSVTFVSQPGHVRQTVALPAEPLWKLTMLDAALGSHPDVRSRYDVM